MTDWTRLASTIALAVCSLPWLAAPGTAPAQDRPVEPPAPSPQHATTSPGDPLPPSIVRKLKASGVPQPLLQPVVENGDWSTARVLLERAQSHQIADRSSAARPKALSDFIQVEPSSGNYKQAWPDPDAPYFPASPLRPAGDVNGDGVNDWVRIFRGADERTADLDRTWRTLLTFGGSAPSGAADQELYSRLLPIGDLTGDGHDDAIEATSLINEDSPRIYTGGPSGYTDTGTDLSTVPYEYSTSTGFADLDGDGYDDVVFVPRFGSPNTVQVHYGAASPENVQAESYPTAVDYSGRKFVRMDDLDGDGTTELVYVVTQEGADPEVEVYTVTQSRDLRLQESFAMDVDRDYLSAVYLRDVDGDAVQELFATAFIGELYAFDTGSAGTYESTPIRLFNASSGGLSASGLHPVGDLNDDGRADWMFYRCESSVCSTAEGTYTYHYAFGTDDYANGLPESDVRPTGVDERRWFPHPRASFGDLTGDGIDDFAIAWEHPGDRNIELDLLQGGSSGPTNVNGTTFLGENYPSDNVTHTFNAGDWNGDGTPDYGLVIEEDEMYWTNAARVEIYGGTPFVDGGPLATYAMPANTTVTAITSGDFTGDGTRNLAVLLEWTTTAGESSPPDPLVQFYASGQTGALQSLTLEDLTGPGYQASGDIFLNDIANAGDLNNDGIDDVAIASGIFRDVYLYPGASTLPASPSSMITYDQTGVNTFGQVTNVVGAGDLNGDGIDDLVAGDVSYRGPNDGREGGLYVHYGTNAPFDFSAPDAILSPQPASEGDQQFFSNGGIAVGDYNADGHPDVAAKYGRGDYVQTGSVPALYVWAGGPSFDAEPDAARDVPADIFAPSQGSDGVFAGLEGPLVSLPAIDEGDELAIGSGNWTNAAVYPGQADGVLGTASTALLSPSMEEGLGGFGSRVRAAGDFNGDGSTAVLFPQPSPVYVSTPVYSYSLESGDLPVELATFTGTAGEDGIRLEWTTTSESGNAGFDVQRRVGSEGPFTTVGFRAGSGTSRETTRYRFVDRSVPFEAGAVTYRLKQVDTDGTTTRSDPITVRRGTPSTLALHGASPNPARSSATLRYELPAAADVQIRVYDVLGRVVATVENERQTAGRKELRLDTSRWASGTYFVRITTPEEARTQRLVIVR